MKSASEMHNAQAGLLCARDITFGLGQHKIVSGLNFDCASGQLTSVIGPNGAGKSTLLKILAGLVQPDHGTISLSGVDYAHDQTRIRKLAYLPQFPSVAWPITVTELVALGLYALARLSPDEKSERIEQMLERCGISDLAQRRVTSLSGGELARAMLARLLVSEAEFLLLDEPVQSLDPAWALGFMEILKEETRSGRGVVVVLHDLSLARHFSDITILMQAGHIVEAGLPAQVLTPERLAAVYGTSFTCSDEFIVATFGD